MKKIIYFICFYFLPVFVFATSGSCSDHWGVSCFAGADWDGSVICNDGWRDSTASFSNEKQCNDINSCPIYLSDIDYKKMKSEIESNISKIKKTTEEMCDDFFVSNESTNEQYYKSCTDFNDQINRNSTVTGRDPSSVSFLLKDCESEKQDRNKENLNKKQICLGRDIDIILKYTNMLSCMHSESEYVTKLKNSCSSVIENSYYNENNGYCTCKETDILINGKCINMEEEDKICRTTFSLNSVWNGEFKKDGTPYCICDTKYKLSLNNKEIDPLNGKKIICVDKEYNILTTVKNSVNKKEEQKESYVKPTDVKIEKIEKNNSIESISTSSENNQILIDSVKTEIKKTWYNKIWKFIWRF